MPREANGTTNGMEANGHYSPALPAAGQHPMPASMNSAPQEPKLASAAPVKGRISRSDRISYHSAGLLFAALIIRYSYPVQSQELIVEMRFLTALFASCFALGISGWFSNDNHANTKLDAVFTIAALAVLVSLLDTWLSGSAPSFVAKFMNLISAVKFK